MPYHKPWTPTTTLPTLISTILAIVYALSILAYPPRHRKLAFLILCLPVLYAFIHHLSLTPWLTINDTFGRLLYIWLAHMSHVFLILEFTPIVTEGRDTWEERLWQAYKILYTRHPRPSFVPLSSEKWREPISASRRRRLPHHLSWLRFCTLHIAKAALFMGISYTWDTYIDIHTFSTPFSFNPSHASFFRRLPASFNADELRTRVMMTWDVCVGDMLYFESMHSLFALLFVGVLRLDQPSEWDLGLFGSVSDCWSVRRYWGVYWHDYIYASFSAHVKLVTRRCMRLERGNGGTRIIENGFVFLVSGLMHSLVRYVQTGGGGEIWTVAVWYEAQMLPIVLEDVVQHLWVRSSLKMELQRWFDEGVVGKLERGVGYVWVFAWMFWTVPKYLLTRHACDSANLRRMYPELFGRLGESLKVT